ncbi:MAG: hypothetical protein H8E37_09615 [Planctomycetes bacterium]|nr:hypothetical protein [Planctomycetota bacterium]
MATEARKGDLNEQRAALEAGRPKGETVGESIARNAKIHAIAKKAAAEGFETPGERATERPVFDIGKLTRPMAAETKTERVTPRSVVDTFSRTDRPTVKPAAIGTPEKSPDSRIAPGFAAELKVMHGLQREANAHLSKVVTELVATKTAITQADNDRTAILGR